MMKGKRILSLVLTMVFVFALFGPTQFAFAAGTDTAAAAPTSSDIVILYTNDVHCTVDAGIGYAGVAAYKAEMLKTNKYVTLVDNGDAIQGGTLGTLSNGSYIVDIMNKVGYDIAVPGNHEFDYGMSRFLSLAKKLKSGYISSNFIDLKTGKPVFEGYKMVSYGDVKVAYVGISTPESISKSTPTYFQDTKGNYIYGFCADDSGNELYKAVQASIDAAKAAGATYVVAVGHCGIDGQSAPWRSTDIIANVSGLTAFIDGHSHSVLPQLKIRDKHNKMVVLTSSGTKLSAIGKVVIKSNGTVTSELIKEYKDKDEDVVAYVNGIKAKNDAILKKVVAKSNVLLTTTDANGKRAVRKAETNLGDLAADAYRIVGKADIGWVNGGGLRADIKAGNITYGDIINVFPFNNALCVVEATGAEILDALEMSARVCPEENGGFLHVSGLKFTIDTSVRSSVVVDSNKMFVSVGATRRVKDVQVLNKSGTYEPIDAAKVYTLASHNYMLKSGGDGINMFMDNKFIKDSVMLDNQLLITFITKDLKGSIPSSYAKSQGRITIVSGASQTENAA